MVLVFVTERVVIDGSRMKGEQRTICYKAGVRSQGKGRKHMLWRRKVQQTVSSSCQTAEI